MKLKICNVEKKKELRFEKPSKNKKRPTPELSNEIKWRESNENMWDGSNLQFLILDGVGDF